MLKKIIAAGICAVTVGFPTTVVANGEEIEEKEVSPVVQITAEEAEILMN